MIAKILLNTTVNNLNRVYDYIIPNELICDIKIGKRVLVPFGRGNRDEEGIVVKLEDEYIGKYKLKGIKEILDKESYINEVNLKVAKWMSYLYFCNVYDALKLMLPPGTNNLNNSKNLLTNLVTVVTPIKSESEFLQDVEEGIIKSPRHIRLLNFVYSNSLVTLSDIKEGLDISSGIVNTVVKNGYLKKQKIKLEKNHLDINNIEKSYPLDPTKEQKLAIDGITSLLGSFNTSLLFGITGSGKTEVYLQVIDKVLNMGQTAILLVPEISLTHQTMTRFISRFGDVVSVLHSKMTISERKDEYLKIYSGKSRIVVGARSALFAPIKDLGIVIIDEEHDSSYISQSTPKYNSKEVAEYICRLNNCPLLLGSATPSVTTYYKCKNGNYNLFEMRNRPLDSKLPKAYLVDKNEDALSNRNLITERLRKEIEINIKNKEQTMILINRRGYSSYLTCKDCKHIFKCPNCDVAMTYHKSNDLLICHYCNTSLKNVKVCPICGSNNISSSTKGIQKYEEELKRLFKDVTILRMDRDTTVLKDSHANILTKFKEENINILIGTQMISKGHDVPNVTLVGVLGTDSMLNMNDCYSSERAYSNISQVSGRAGRGEKEGRVIIETEDVDNSILSYALNHDYESFYKDEIVFRKTFMYPPFVDLFLISMTCKDLYILKEDANKLYEIMNKSNKYTVYTPKTPFIQKIKKNFRINILIKAKLSNEVLKEIYNGIGEYNKIKKSKVRYSVVRNPSNLG